MEIKKNKLYDFVCSIKSPYDNIHNQYNNSENVKRLLENNKEANKFDLTLMEPKVSYSDWIVCLYHKDKKFYRIDTENIIEVTCIAGFKYNENFEIIDENGNLLDEFDLVDYHFCLCCGEADDMQSYLYFDDVA